MLRTSERRTFKRCQAQWFWAWQSGLTAKTTRPGALWFGTGIHLALEEYYSPLGLTRRSKDNVIRTWLDFCNDEQLMIRTEDGEFETPKWVDAKELGAVMLDAYIEEYQGDKEWFILSTEQSFEIEIPHPKSGKPLAVYCGTFDIVARKEEDGSLWLWDHKTAKAISTSHLSLDDQAGSYWAFAAHVLAEKGIVPGDARLDGILYNFLRKAKADERPKNRHGEATNKPRIQDYHEVFDSLGVPYFRKEGLKDLEARALTFDIQVLGPVSKNQPTPVFLREEVFRTPGERLTQIKKIQAEALQIEAVRSKALPITKNPTKDCAFDCSFKNMCELHEQPGSDWKRFRDSMYATRDPYKAHRESTDE